MHFLFYFFTSFSKSLQHKYPTHETFKLLALDSFTPVRAVEASSC